MFLYVYSIADDASLNGLLSIKLQAHFNDSISILVDGHVYNTTSSYVSPRTRIKTNIEKVCCKKDNINSELENVKKNELSQSPESIEEQKKNVFLKYLSIITS